MSFNTTRSDDSSTTPTDTLAASKLHPGEYGRVEAWLNRTILDLEMQRDKYGFNPAIAFAPRAPMYTMIPTIAQPAGMEATDVATREAQIR